MSDSCDFIEQSRTLYENHLQEIYGEPRGSSQLEIDAFEKKHRIALPCAYRQYLRWMGDDISGPLEGSEWFLKNLEENNALLPDLLSENGISYDERSDLICFFSHQGYMAAWFYLTPHEENPTVFFYSESQPENTPIQEGKFSDFLLTELKSIASCG